MTYNVKDIKLAKKGQKKIDWAENHMPVLLNIRKDFEREKPLKDICVGFALHVTKETAALVRTLRCGGAKVAITSCNPLSTQDDVAAALAEDGINVYAWRGETTEEYYENIDRVLDHKPEITIDDGADLIFAIHSKRPELIEGIRGGCEETTTGIVRLRAMEKDNALKYPVLAVNDALTKYMFDNRYGTGQSTLDGILRATSVLLAGKVFVVGGYGWCGKGIAMRAKGMGSSVVITEVDPTRALEAVMDGFRVMPMREAAKIGDICVTATGDADVIRKEHIGEMKNGAILANSGHFNVELDVSGLDELSIDKTNIRENVERYKLKNGRYVYLLAEGRLVNLAAAEGHPSEVMDMSFADQALAVKYIADHDLEPGVHEIPKEIDERVAELKLQTMDIEIDRLSERQREYLSSWKEGT